MTILKMGLEIDIESFLLNLRATKPPYTCPYERCQKTYKSYQGISYHLCNQHNVDGESAATGDEDAKKKGGRSTASSSVRNRSPSGSDYTSSVTGREALTYAEAQRMIEVEIDGRTHRININEPLNIFLEDKNSKFNGMTSSNMNETSRETDRAISSVSSLETESNSRTKEGKNGLQGRGNKSSKTGKKAKGKSTKTVAKVKVESLSPEKPKLPEASFRRVENPIEVPDAEPRPASYFRFIEKSLDELDDSIEYDMDEEDTVWLQLINKKRRADRLPEVPADTFELLMDRLEKESYFLSQDCKNNQGLTPAIDEDAVCVICNDGDCQNSNAILFCDMCDLAVHQECYGVPYIPEGQWLCRKCLHSPSAPVDCVLCPNKGGAFKQTDKSEWAHVVCAIWIPEVCFANTVFLEPIDSIENITPARWRLNCYICKQKGIGACIQCHKTNCYVAFHVTCAQSAGLFMQIDIDKNKNGVQSIKKAAYCHSHTPADEAAGMQVPLSGVYSTREDDRSSVKTKNKKTLKIPAPNDKTTAANESDFKEKIRKTRKILAEKRSAEPRVSIPTIPPDRLTAIAEKMTFSKRNQFLQRLLGYWTLKRQSRNGVPLLRRLQVSYMGNRRSGDMIEADSDVIKKWKEQHKYLQRLRQDLEKARLLVELIRKREKVKRQLVEAYQSVIEIHLQPFKLFLKQVLKQMSHKDTNEFFQQPVSVNDVPDYFDFISNPMDFSTMAKKVDECKYNSFDAFEKDFNLMIENCKEYNDPDTIYFKAANKLKDICRGVLKDAKSMIQEIGFNEKGGIHEPPVCIKERPLKPPSVTLSMKPFSTTTTAGIFTSATSSKEQSLKHKLKELTTAFDKTSQMKAGSSRAHRMKQIRDEISQLKKDLHSLNPSVYPLPASSDAGSDEGTPSKKRKASPDKSLTQTPNKKLKVNLSTPKTPLRTPKNEFVSDSEATDIYHFSSPEKSSPKKKGLKSGKKTNQDSKIAKVKKIKKKLLVQESNGSRKKESNGLMKKKKKIKSKELTHSSGSNPVMKKLLNKKRKLSSPSSSKGEKKKGKKPKTASDSLKTTDSTD